MNIWNIVRRDLLRLVRSPGRTAMLFAVPLTLAAIFALVFGGSSGSPEFSIRVLLYDEDDSLLSNVLKGAADSDQANRIDLEVVGAEGYERMERGDASALVHIPEGFSQALLDGEPTTIKLVKNPSERFMPQVVEVGLDLGSVLLSQGSRVLRPELEQLDGILNSDAAPSDEIISLLSVGFNQRFQSFGEYVFPPVIELEAVTLKDEEEQPDVGILSFFLPGLSILGMLFLAQSATRDLHRDRESGLLRQLLTAPVSMADYLMGKSLSVLLITSLGFAVLILLGVLAGVSWGPPLAAMLMVLASSLGISGALLLLTSLSRNQQAGDTLTSIVIIVWSMIGGSFVPLSQLPPFILPLSKSSPTYWATDGFNALILRGGGLPDVMPNLAVLAIVGMVGMSLGATILRRRMLAGES